MTGIDTAPATGTEFEWRNLDPATRLLVVHDIRKTARYLRRHGWCQQRFEDRHGGVCLMTAIGKAAAGARSLMVYDAVASYLRVEAGVDVISWNDSVAQHGEQVVAMLLSLADALDGRAAS